MHSTIIIISLILPNNWIYKTQQTVKNGKHRMLTCHYTLYFIKRNLHCCVVLSIVVFISFFCLFFSTGCTRVIVFLDDRFTVRNVVFTLSSTEHVHVHLYIYQNCFNIKNYHCSVQYWTIECTVLVHVVCCPMCLLV